MQLLAQWRDSLTFFSPPNLASFIGDCFNTVITTYNVWLKHFWWLIISYCVLLAWHQPSTFSGLFIIFGFFDTFIFQETTYFNLIMYVLGTCVWGVLMVTLFLSARHTAQVKSYHYFISYWRKGLCISAWFIGIALLWWVLLALAIFVGMIGQVWLGVALMACALVTCIMIPSINLFFVFFMCDAGDSWSDVLISIKNAGRLSLYNFFPCLFIGITMMTLHIGLIWIGSSVVNFLGYSTSSPWYHSGIQNAHRFILIPAMVGIAYTLYNACVQNVEYYQYKKKEK